MNDVRFPVPKQQPQRVSRPGIARRRTSAQWLIVWHRRIGLAAAIVVVLLAVSGLLLNHTHRLGLDQTQVTANWLLRWYGFPTAADAISYRAGEQWISWTGARLMLDDKPVMETQTAPIGAAALPQGLLAAGFPDALALIDAGGAIIERIGAESLPGTLQRIGTNTEGLIVVETPQGRFVADRDLIAWRATNADPAWSHTADAPAALREQLLRAERGPGLPAERVLQDLHSGRIFGPWGPWLMDAAAIAFVVMAITGIVFWWNQRRRTMTYRRSGEDRRHRA